MGRKRFNVRSFFPSQFYTVGNSLLLNIFCCLVFIISTALSADGQVPVPGIRANGVILNGGDTVQVCLGTSIQYQSTAQGATVTNWRFKNGVPATVNNSVNPVAIFYNSAGIDSTVQTVINGTDSASMFIFVKVNDQKPTASFTFSHTDSCGNIPVVFNSSGSVGNPDPLKYRWDFGDGGSSTASSPSYQFLSATGVTGSTTYTVKLVVTNNFNCADSTTRVVTVKKIPDASLGNPDANVQFSPFNGVPTFRRCENISSYLFQFSNATTTAAINTKYTISWGDSSPDSTFTSWPAGVVIAHPYAIGQRQMTVTVEGSNGCIGIKKYNIFLGTTPAGGFASLGNTSICAPNSLRFVITGYQTNTTGTTYKFTVNDGSLPQLYSSPPPDTVSHVFSIGSCGNYSSNGSQSFPNAYSATLDVENPCGSTSVSVIPIYVSGRPRAAITINPATTVCTNYPVSIINSSPYGGTIVPTGGGNSTCTNSGKQVWRISPATGYTVTGSLGSTNNAPTNGLLWTSGSSALSVNFNTPGTYVVRLFVGNDLCGIDSITKTICVRNPPQASFKFNKRSSCGVDTALINNTSPTGSCLGDTYKWTITYSDPSACGGTANYSFVNATSDTSKNPAIRFATPGRYIVKLTLTSVGTAFTCPTATYQDTFWVKAKPKAVINPITAVCIGNTIAPSANATNCYGDSSLTYLWTFANGTPSTSLSAIPGSILFNATGTYPITLDVSNECGTTTATSAATITSTPVANAGVDTTVCSGVAVKVGSAAVGGLTYSWLPATGLSSSTIANPTATLTYNGPSADTTFTFVVTAAAGANCAGKDTVNITVKKRPVVSINPVTAAVCTGSGTAMVATGADSYAWSPSASLNVSTGDTVIASPLTNTIYTVTGTANGCSAAATATITVVAYPNANAGTDTTVCNTSSAVQLTGTPTGGVWSGSSFITSSGLFNAASAGNGSYSLVYTVSNGNCAKTDTVIVSVINPPVAYAGRDTTICQSVLSIQLNGVPANGKWSGSSVTSSGQFTPATAGNYSLVYSIGAGTCTARDTVIITVANGITNNLISANQNICAGSLPSAIIGRDATGGNGVAVYQWQVSTDSTNWTDIVNATLRDYTPAALTQTTYYRRIASTTLCSGVQANNSNVVKITINPDAKAAFNPTTTKGCVPFVITPAIINVTPYSSVGEYRWYVNGSYIGSGQNFPGYTMTNTGDSITIKLLAVSKFGCKNDSLQFGFVTVERPSPSFTQSDSVGCGPLTVSFVNTTLNANRYTFIWNFGQAQTSTLQQPPSITFPANVNNTDTIYIVTLKALNACDTIIATQQVRVKSKPKALFTPDKSEGCSPMTVTFSNTSRGTNVSYTWNFGDGSAPVNSNAATIEHTFIVGAKDTFRVKLVAVNECGADSINYAIVVNPNTIHIDFAINGNDRFGCAPHTVQFINNTVGANSFKWSFGDGTTISTTKGIDTIYHTYTTAGNFNATLFATNSCSDTTDVEPITVQVKPAVSFTAPSIVCLADTIHFINTSDNGISNLWNFGDGTTSFNRNPVKKYNQPGNYHVLLIGSNVFAQGFSCIDSAYINILVRDTLAGDFIMSDSVSGCLPFTVTFKNVNTPATQTTWNFGDGSIATGDNVSHTYTTGGSFIVQMTSVSSSGCIYDAAKIININSPTGSLTYTGGFSCFGSPARFEIKGGNASRYTFVFDDGDSVTTSNPLVFHQYNKAGYYVPFAYLVEGNCRIKVFTGDTIKIDKLTAGFSKSVLYNCGSTTVQFNDTSIAYFGITSRQWNLGDGSTSSQRSLQKTYVQSGTYYIRLQITGASGCTDTVTLPVDIAVRSFPSGAIGADSLACTGQAVNLAAMVQSADSVANYSWNFGNGIIASGKNVSAIYNTSGIYTARLIINTIYGCSDTAYKIIKINASPIVNAGADVRICRGQSVQLNASGATTYQWTPLQNLSCNTCANPIATPSLSTLYVVRGTNNVSCSVSDTLLVDVVQPFKLTVSPNDSICVGDKTQLFAAGATRYLWNPVSGLSNGTVANPVANPTVTTQYTVIGSDPYNCFADTGYVTVAVGNYPTVDLGTGGAFVAGTTFTINPILTNGPFKNYTWAPITDLSCSNCYAPVVTIKNDITYRLEVTNIYGCKASDTIMYKATCEEALQVYIPNAFSPDGDGLNDVLMVRGKGLATVKYFRIFNRWGQLVFERSNFNANDPQQGWDGKVNGVPANPDVYVYTAEVVCTAGNNFIKKGNVTLVR